MNYRSSHVLTSKSAFSFAAQLFVGLLLLAAVGMASANPKSPQAIKPHAAPMLTIVHNFNQTSDGTLLGEGLVQGPDGSLYGVTQFGVYKIAPDNTFSVLHSFSFSDGSTPQARLLLVGNLLFGTCSQNGGNNVSHQSGTVFAIDLSQVSATDNSAGFAILHYFGYSVTAAAGGGTTVTNDPTDGATPEGRLLLASDGNIYGTTSAGGANGLGTIFVIQPDGNGKFSVTPPSDHSNGSQFYLFNGTYHKIYDFTGGATGGANPHGGVIQLSDGFLYGTTFAGGNPSTGTGANSDPNATSFGTIYKIAPDGTNFLLLHAFTGGIVFDTNFNIISTGDGENPICDLTQFRDGFLYGTTFGGGSSNSGTVFQLTPNPQTHRFDSFSTLQVLHNFNAANEGSGIQGGVTQATDGSLYGVTVSHGAYNGQGGVGNGSVFGIGVDSNGQFSAASPFSTIYTFTPNNVSDAGKPAGGVIQKPDGRLYGETQDGPNLADSSFSGGTVFALDAGLPGAPVITSVTNSGGNPVTVADTTLVINGSNFVAGAIVFVGNIASGTTLTHVSLDSATQLTVTLSQALPSGNHNVTVTDPGSGGFTSNVYVLTIAAVAPPPTINAFPNGILYTLLGGTQGRLTINGANFVDTPTVTVNGPDDGTLSPGTPTVHFNSSNQVTATFSQPLAAGIYGLVLQNPDGRKTTGFNGLFAILGVTGVTYAAPAGGSPTLTLTGGGFLGDPEKTAVFLGADTTGLQIAPSAVSVVDSHTLTVALADTLAPGSYPITVANADGQTATQALTVALPPPTSLYIKINNSGKANAVAIIPNDGFSGSLSDLQINRPDPATIYHNLSSLSAIQAVRPAVQSANHPRLRPHATGGYPVIFSVAANTDLGQSLTQILVEGGGFVAGSGTTGSTITLDGTSYPSVASHQNQILVNVGKGLDPSQKHYLTVQNPSGKASQNELVVPTVGHFLPPSAGSAFVYSSTPSSYKVKVAETKLTGPGTAVGIYASSPSGSQPQSANVGGGTHLIGMNGAALVSHDGGSLIAQDGSSLVSHDGGSVVSNDGGTLVAAGAGNAVPVPPALISQDGGGVVSNDGGTLISQDGSGLISQDGGGLTGGEVLQGATGLTAGVRPAAAHAVTSRAVTGSGYMDLSLFVSKGMQTLNLLTIRYTPGRRDLIIYQDPSVTLTPVNGTPAPITVAPVSVTVTRAPLTLDPKTHQPYQILTLKNTGAATLTGPVDVALTGLPATVTVIGAAGTLNSSPALTATGGPLAPGASVQVRVNFSNPGNARFSYGTAVYTGAL